MGKKEEPMMYYYEKEQHFAELINGWLFHGETEILPKQVHPIMGRYTARSGKSRQTRYRTRYRDIIKKVEGFRIRLILGMELQSYIDYTMPVRVMDYDVVEYSSQITAARRKRRRQNPKKVCLSGLNKNERLTPVLTLVLYLGEAEWDAAQNLHEILDFGKIPDTLRSYIPDYPVHVLDIRHTPDERLMEFPDDIACMFLVLKYQKNKKKLLEIMESHPAFQHVKEDTYEAVWSYTNTTRLLELKEEITEKEGTINMCQAIDEIFEDGKKEGRIQGERHALKRANKLASLLISENRFDDLKRAVCDEAYQHQLFQAYGI